jgi:hypothetical protein
LVRKVRPSLKGADFRFCLMAVRAESLPLRIFGDLLRLSQRRLQPSICKSN